MLFDYPQRELAVMTITNLVIQYLNNITDCLNWICMMLEPMDYKVASLVLILLRVKLLVLKYHCQITICVACENNMIFIYS